MPSTPATPGAPATHAPVEERDEATVRFAGDLSDGMQMVGNRFTHALDLFGNSVSTLPDFPAEIRAPAGTLAGVSGFQVHFGRETVRAPGDFIDTLVAMNPAALRANLGDLQPGGVLLLNADAFTQEEIEKAGYRGSLLADGTLRAFRVFSIPMTTLTLEAVARVNLMPHEAERCKNFFALGLVCWLYGQPLEPTLRWIADKFLPNPGVRDANKRTLNAGYRYGEKTESLPTPIRVAKAAWKPGRYRRVTGDEATCLGLLAAAQKSGLQLVFAAAPMTPSSEILQQMCEWRRFGVRALQSEDEIAAVGMALGAAFGGALGVTATSGPGLSLASETLGLAVMAELPLVLIDVQRAGPSTGMPSKPEQADLLQAMFGRHGECPLVVLAPASPSDCFGTMLEAVRVAVAAMTPVLVLTDSSLAYAAETWRVPRVDELAKIVVTHPRTDVKPFQPYSRDDHLARPWAVPGVAGLEHRIGGQEKEPLTGNVSFDPLHHEAMVQTRADKIAKLADQMPELAVDGPDRGDLLVIGWGSTFGAIRAAVQRCRARKMSVASAHLRCLNPLPRNLGDVLKRYRKVLVPELNRGQLRLLLRAEYLVDAVGLNKVQGVPFLVREIEDKISALLPSVPS
jgi:2-oxoglutarate ferredoxin oxidoreductase subunit alpha